MIAQDRLQRAAAFIAQLHRLSINSPHSWRRAQTIGRDIGRADAELEQAICDAQKAGFIQRQVDDEGLVLLTAEGRAAASLSRYLDPTGGPCPVTNPKSVGELPSWSVEL